jgi:enoyl-[acyl-carrier protein] reductase II
MSREYVRREKQGAGLEELERYTLGSLRRAVFDGDTESGSLMAGQTCGQLTAIRPAVEILDEMYVNAKHVLHNASSIAI